MSPRSGEARTLARVTGLIDRLAQGLGLLGQGVLAFMLVSIGYDVVMRYFFVAPTQWSLEVNTFLLVFLGLIPASDVLRTDGHLRITFLLSRLGTRGRLALHVMTCLLGIAFSAFMVWKGAEMSFQALRYGERMSTPLGTPMVVPYLFIPIGFALLGLQFAAKLAHAAIEGPPPLEAGPEAGDVL